MESSNTTTATMMTEKEKKKRERKDYIKVLYARKKAATEMRKNLVEISPEVISRYRDIDIHKEPLAGLALEEDVRSKYQKEVVEGVVPVRTAQLLYAILPKRQAVNVPPILPKQNTGNESIYSLV